MGFVPRELAPASAGHTLPGALALDFLDLMKGFRVPAAALLEGLELTEAQLEEPNARVAVATMNQLIARGRERSGEPGIGVFMGLRRRLSNYGFLGLAAMHARTLRQAVELMVEFAPVVSTTITLRFEVDGKLASLQLIENVDLGPVRDVVLLSMLIGMQQMSFTLTGREPTGVVEIAVPKPIYYHRFVDVLASVVFDRPQTRLVFDSSFLDMPIAAADRATLRLARAQCEQLLARLVQSASFVDCVRRLIPQPEGFRTLEQVAALLGLSSRTLKRKLAGQSVSFSEMVESERHERAQFLLRWSEQPLEQVAQQLGYATLPNFIRAFKRWSGETPAVYRRANRVEPPAPVAAQAPVSLPPAAADIGAPTTSQFG